MQYDIIPIAGSKRASVSSQICMVLRRVPLSKRRNKPHPVQLELLVVGCQTTNLLIERAVRPTAVVVVRQLSTEKNVQLVVTRQNYLVDKAVQLVFARQLLWYHTFRKKVHVCTYVFVCVLATHVYVRTTGSMHSNFQPTKEIKMIIIAGDCCLWLSCC